MKEPNTSSLDTLINLKVVKHENSGWDATVLFRDSVKDWAKNPPNRTEKIKLALRASSMAKRVVLKHRSIANKKNLEKIMVYFILLENYVKTNKISLNLNNDDPVDLFYALLWLDDKIPELLES